MSRQIFTSLLTLTLFAALLVAVVNSCGRSESDRAGDALLGDAITPADVSEGGPEEQRAFMRTLREGPTASLKLAVYGDYWFLGEEFESYMSLFPPKKWAGAPIESIYNLPFERFREVVSFIVSDYIMADKAREQNLFSKVEAPFDIYTQDALLTALLKQSVETPTEYTMEALATRMKLNMDEYTLPLEAEVIHLFFPTLEATTVAEGETLEAIAERACGDAGRARAIRDAASKQLLWTPPERRRFGFHLPPEPGATVLAPVSPEKRRAARKRAEKVMARIRSGESLERVGMDSGFSQAELRPLPPIPRGREALAPEIYEALNDPDWRVGTTTGVIETQNGYHILYLHSRREPGVESMAEAYAKLADKEVQEQSKETIEEFLSDLSDKRLVFHNDTLMDDDATSEDVICEAYGREFTVGDIMEIDEHPKFMSRDPDRRRERIRQLRPLKRFIGLREAERLGLDKSPEHRRLVEAARVFFLSDAYLSSEVEKRYSEDDEHLRSYYEDHIDQFKRPKLYHLWELALRPDGQRAEAVEQAMARLEEVKASIETLEDFEERAVDLDYRSGVRWARGDVGEWPGEYRGEAFAHILDAAPVGEPLGPFRNGSDCLLVWIGEVKPAEPKPFEDAKGDVLRMYRRETLPRLEKDIRQETLDEAGFRMAVTRSRAGAE